MALLNKDPSTYEKEKERFLQELTHFHETRGTPSRRPPKINGYEIDLCMLYNLVTSRGGWVKVNSRNEWDEILSDFDLPKRCVNSSVALKQIYLRYLDRYEKIHFLGEVGERGADDDEDSRHRRWSARSLHSVPLTYNHAQHLVNESLREYNGLSVDLYKPTEYEKLALSLISPLPNEQDFAINVCTLLSNEGKHSLKLEKHPRLLHSLLAHAAVFSNSTLRQLFTELYGKDRGHSMNHLWRDTVPDPQILRLADESQFSDIPRDRTEASGSSCKVGLTLDQEDQELFCVGRTLGIQDYVGQRVCQIASIVRNLSFINENVVIMGNDITFLRFVLLCCGSKWNGLQQLGWDMLGNIASEVSVQSPLIDDVLNMASKGLLSQDRAIIIASLEILNKLAQCEKNEDILLRSMRQEIYDRICSFLTLHDIMLLVYTLECLNSISSLGEKACNAILRVRGSLDVLVSLITVEAQSYGPKACIQMRVVETVSGSTTSGIVCQPSSQATTVTSSSSSVVVTSTTNTSSVSSLSTTMLTGVSTSSLISSTTTPLTQTVLTSVATSTTSVQPSTSTTPILPKAPVTPVVANAAHATQQVAQENEQFALAWLRSTFEPQNGAMIEQAELYKQYINYCAKIGRRGVIAPLHFPRCVRSVFGGTIGPKLVTSGESTQKHFYEGIQLRAKPLIPQVCQPQTTSVSTATVTIPPSPAPSTPSPILKAQLSAPPKPTSTPNSMALKVTQRQQQQKLLLQQQSSPPKTVPPPTATASFGAQTSPIEDSLLVNPSKITSTTTTYQAKPGLPCKVNGVRSGNEATEKIEVLQPNGSQIFSPSSIDSINRPPPLAPLSTKFNSVNSVAVTTDVTGPNPINSGTKEMGAGTRDDIGDNSMGSLDGFLLNGIPSSIDSSETTNIRETPTKSVMLADLLEKNIDKNEPPVLNGSLRIGDKGLELIQSTTELVDEKPSLPPPPPLANILPDDNRNMNGVTEAPTIKQEDVKPSSDSLKRPAEGGDEECSDAKKPHLNGEVKEEPLEECNVSSTAANLYAAFAADALEDEPLDELPPQPVIIAPTQPRQILVAAGGQLAQRVVVGGQHYVVAQSQAALVQGQTQTVLVAQTPQQQGTTAKTIIILQPQTVATASPQPQSKVIVQRLQSPPPVVPPHPPPLPSSPMLTATQSTIAAPIVRTITPSKPTPPPPPPPPTPSPTSVITAHKNFKVIKPTTSTTVTTNSVAVSTSTHSQTTTVQASSPAIPSVPAPCATPVTITTPSVTSVSVATTNSSTQVVIPSTSNQLTSKSPVEQQGHFLCEWRGCMRNFKSGHEVYMHACEAHCPQGSQEIQCLWERCDAMKRKRFSLMTHLYDKHCNTDVMRMMAVRRKQLSVTGRSEIPAPSPATPHPGYAPNAAFHAIKRHALEFVNPKELQQRPAKPGPMPAPVQVEQDDNEGPVTKSIRLTAAMILRNLVIYSTNGRRHLTRYEAHLASVALSNVESSRTIAHVLYDMSQSR